LTGDTRRVTFAAREDPAAVVVEEDLGIALSSLWMTDEDEEAGDSSSRRRE
jgi:hypothetical protein